jgi:YidC/Oxa1 family membrane protein insertase
MARKPQKPPEQEQPAQDGEAQPGQPAQPGAPDNGGEPENGGAPAPGPGEEPAPAPAPESHPQQDRPEIRARLESEELVVGFTSRGGAIEFVTLKHAREGGEDSRPLDLVVPADPLLLPGQIDSTVLKPAASPGAWDRKNEPAGALRSLHWTRDEAAEGATPDADLVFTFDTPEGLRFTKRWWLAPGAGRHDVHLEISVVGLRADAPKEVTVKLLAASGQLRERVEGAFAVPSGVVYRLSTSNDLSDTMPFGTGVTEIEPGGLRPTRLETLGTRSAYFLFALYPPEGAAEADVLRIWSTGEQADQRAVMQERIRDFYLREHERTLGGADPLVGRIQEGVAQMNHAWAVLRLGTDAAASKPLHVAFYAGPVDRATIRAHDGYDVLRPVLTYPNAADWVADILLWIYDLWRSLLGNAGLAVILMTLCVRGGLMPLSVRNQLAMRSYGRKVAKLKPKVKALQEKFGSNPKRLREEQMKLYREEKIGFPSGCLMMLVQIPIFFALFSSLRVEYTIRGASFLWISDLSGPDKLIDFGTRLFDIGLLYVESLNVLPLLMVFLSMWHVRQMPAPADEQQAQQQKIMKWLPIFFAVILYNYTAALSLYMVLSSLIAILESRIVKARDEQLMAAAA